MNRERLNLMIKNELCYLGYQVTVSGKLNELGINTHCEQFYCNLFNLVYGFNLYNINSDKSIPNVAGIDLVDDVNKIFVQVSSILSTDKIEKSIAKKNLLNYPGYSFYFISLAKDATNFRNKTYNNPNGIIFNPKTDIYDIASICTKIKSLSIPELEKIYNLVVEEIGPTYDASKLNSELTAVIDSLATNDSPIVDETTLNSFKIEEKISFNNLDEIKDDIFDKMNYYSIVNDIYNTYASQGKNVSNHVFTKIKALFRRTKSTDSVQKFDELISYMKNEVKDSKNFDFESISSEALEYYCQIIAIDAFIKCKIYLNPEGYTYDNAQ